MTVAASSVAFPGLALATFVGDVPVIERTQGHVGTDTVQDGQHIVIIVQETRDPLATALRIDRVERVLRVVVAVVVEVLQVHVVFVLEVPEVVVDVLAAAQVALAGTALRSGAVVAVAGTVVVEYEEVGVHVSWLHAGEAVLTGVDIDGVVATGASADQGLPVAGSAALGV